MSRFCASIVSESRLLREGEEDEIKKRLRFPSLRVHGGFESSAGYSLLGHDCACAWCHVQRVAILPNPVRHIKFSHS